MMFSKHLLFFSLLVLLGGCQKKDLLKDRPPKENLHGEYVYRYQNEFFYQPPAPTAVFRDPYPWEKSFIGSLPRITKDFFRCRGHMLHPVRSVESAGKEPQILRDCGGAEKHGLPLKEGKEFVYPCLIEILNYIQEKTQKKVVITAGHRCPPHQLYCMPTNQTSKHQIGAEVTFYVEGYEHRPESIISLIQSYYQTTPPFKGNSSFEKFQRYEKPDTDVSTQPWHNKELFIKLYKPEEGRNIDNSHSYPYISLQVRYDRDTDKQVRYDWPTAQKFLRY